MLFYDITDTYCLMRIFFIYLWCPTLGRVSLFSVIAITCKIGQVFQERVEVISLALLRPVSAPVNTNCVIKLIKKKYFLF